MHILELIQTVEDLIQEVIRQSHPSSWDEDHISYSLVTGMGRLPSMEIRGLDRSFNIQWDLRKLLGPTETSLGDLGVLVRLTQWDGEVLEGLGLLEAKKRHLKNSNFEAMNKTQLKRILRNAPHSQLLLYDYVGVTEFRDNLPMHSVSDDYWWRRGMPRPIIEKSHALVVPLNVAVASGEKNHSLYKYTIPFSLQLCTRYFRGFDLDFSRTNNTDVKTFVARQGGPRNLLLVGVSTGSTEPALPQGYDPDSYGPNG